MHGVRSGVTLRRPLLKQVTASEDMGSFEGDEHA